MNLCLHGPSSLLSTGLLTINQVTELCYCAGIWDLCKVSIIHSDWIRGNVITPALSGRSFVFFMVGINNRPLHLPRIYHADI